MPSDATLLLAALLGLNTILLLVVLMRRGAAGRLDALERALERTERSLREQAAAEARGLREEVGGAIQTLRTGMLQQMEGNASGLRAEVQRSFKAGNDVMLAGMGKLDELQRHRLDRVTGEIGRLSQANEARLEAMRATVEGKLGEMREDNGRQLERMRATVDEQLQGTLDRRLGESFLLVSQRLEEVHRGLGEMQTLATGVGDLKRVLTNVKVRGTWGEVQLGGLLEHILAPEQYAANVATREGSGERVEYAVRLPGRGERDGQVWLPIDSKFPMEDYQRLVEAQVAGDPLAAEEASRALEAAVRRCAGEISAKYLSPPATTDFAIMFLPTEGLFAEAIRRPGLVEALQRDLRVSVAGPTTLAALLSSLQMGFRTLAIQKRSSEVWEVLGAVKTEFGRFGGVLRRAQKKLQEASNVMDQAAVRTRAMERTLRGVEGLPAEEAAVLLPGVVLPELEEE